jgi:hypothetical protein
MVIVVNNHRATLVKEIAHINFAALTGLRLEGNKIESAEGLTRVQMAHIELSTYADNIANNNINQEGYMAFSIMARHR